MKLPIHLVELVPDQRREDLRILPRRLEPKYDRHWRRHQPTEL